MTEYSAPVFIVVRPTLQQDAETAAVTADPDAGEGTFVPGIPLREAGGPNVPAAFWARWNMKPGQRSAFASAIGGPMQVIEPGGNVNLNRDRWMFDANETDGWQPQQVLDVLGLDIYERVDDW